MLCAIPTRMYLDHRDILCLQVLSQACQPPRILCFLRQHVIERWDTHVSVVQQPTHLCSVPVPGILDTNVSSLDYSLFQLFRAKYLGSCLPMRFGH